jgi:hypothetical protein
VPAPQPAYGGRSAAGDLQWQAWQWALANRDDDGALPSGLAIGRAHNRHERWGRLVKSAGLAGAFGADSPPELGEGVDEPAIRAGGIGTGVIREAITDADRRHGDGGGQILGSGPPAAGLVGL